MLAAAGWLLAGAAAAGLGLILASQVAARYVRLRWPGMVHGAAGLLGFALLLFGLRGPVRGMDQGAGSFGVVAAWMVGAALLLGSGLLATRLRRRPPSMLLVGVHATVGVGGLVMLLAYLGS